MKLYYFSVPGRGEASRIMLTIGKVPFEDIRTGGKNWEELKNKMPFGQVPVLELEDGSLLAQSFAIDRFVARKVGLSPEDTIEIARCDEVWALTEELNHVVGPSFLIKDLEERTAERKRLAATSLWSKLEMLDKLLVDKEFFVAGKLTYADIMVFSTMCSYICGFMDGLDKSMYNDFVHLKAFHKRIASIPAIKEYYESQTDPRRAVFKPDLFDD